MKEMIVIRALDNGLWEIQVITRKSQNEMIKRETMSNLINKRGQGLVEYILIVVVMGILALSVIKKLGRQHKVDLRKHPQDSKMPSMENRLIFAIPLLLCLKLTAWASFPPAVEHKALIQIGVEVVEVDEDKTEKLGIQWISNVNVSEVAVPAILKLGTLTRTQLFADLDAMLEEGTADLLANPKLVTRDGTTAEFHAGGELPYATSSGSGATTVEFKAYGVELRISPHLETDGMIALNVEAQVSGPDEQNSVVLSGNQVPGILSRQVSSNVTLSPNATLTLAGLLQNQKQIQWQRVPILGRIPILGLLFSHKVISHKHTSIVVFVTPTILEGEHGLANPS